MLGSIGWPRENTSQRVRDYPRRSTGALLTSSELGPLTAKKCTPNHAKWFARIVLSSFPEDLMFNFHVLKAFELPTDPPHMWKAWRTFNSSLFSHI